MRYVERPADQAEEYIGLLRLLTRLPNLLQYMVINIQSSEPC